MSQGLISFPSKKKRVTNLDNLKGHSPPATSPPTKAKSSSFSASSSPVLVEEIVSSRSPSPELLSINKLTTPITEKHKKPANPREGVLPGSWTDASDDEIILRKFDLDLTYGPCGGLTRRERWERAKQWNLDPPLYVWDILQRVPSQGGSNRTDKKNKEEVGVGALRKRKSSGGGSTKNDGTDISDHSLFENVTARTLADPI